MSAERGPAFAEAARALAIDRVTAEVVGALEEDGIEARLLKGPAIARRFYADDSVRGYSDTDLLVRDGDVERAAQVLDDLGFRSPFRRGEWAGHAVAMVRDADGAVVDLHWTIPGVRAPTDRLWETLGAHTEPMTVGGREVPALSGPALTLHVVVHATQSAPTVQRPREDLRRALDQVDVDEWRQVAALAEQLDATDALTAGLGTDPDGAELVDQLDLPEATSLDARVRTDAPPPLATGLVRALEAPTLTARLRALATRLVPSPAYLRQLLPIARRGRPGLVAAYLVWPFWLARHVPKAIRAVRRARRAPPPQRG